MYNNDINMHQDSVYLNAWVLMLYYTRRNLIYVTQPQDLS